MDEQQLNPAECSEDAEQQLPQQQMMQQEQLPDVQTQDAQTQQAAPAESQAYETDTHTSQAAQDTQNQEGHMLLQQQMQQIATLNPAINSFEALCAMPGFEAFDKLVMQGQDLVSAYKQVQHSQLAPQQAGEAGAQGQSGAVRQAVLNSVQSRGHLARTPQNTGTSWSREVPEQARELWEEMFPDDAPETLRERYNRASEI